MLRRTVCLCAMLACLSPLTLRAQSAGEEQQPDESIWQKANRLTQAFQRLGPWEEHHGYMIDAMEKVFVQNGWTSESDVFALELSADIDSFPPWDYQSRFNALATAIGDRYLLSEEQQQAAAQIFARESVGLFMRHSDRIMDYSLDMLKTRAAGEAITPEQVARWVTLAEPVMNDARDRMNVVVKDFGRELDPEQRELLQRDLEAANRRLHDMDRMAVKWKRGEWSPDDWGLEDDPIQLEGEIRLMEQGGPDLRAKEGAADDADAAAENAGASTDPSQRDAASERQPSDRRPRPSGQAAGGGSPTDQPGRERPAIAPAADEHEWARYVREFIRRYDLNEAQQNRAWAIYKDVRAYGERIEERVDKAVADLRQRQAATQDADARAKLDQQVASANQPLERIFEQMKRRLDRLPTRSQREEAQKKQPPPAPDDARRRANRRADGP